MLGIKKGFFLSLAAIVALLIISSMVATKIAAIEQTRETYQETIKLESYKARFLPINKEFFENMTNDVMYDNIYKLANYTSDPNATILIDVQSSDNTTNVKKALYELFLNGSTNGTYFKNGIGFNNNVNIKTIKEELNKSLNKVGLSLDNFDVAPLKENAPSNAQEVTTITLIDYKTIEVNTTYNISIIDKANKARLEGIFNVSVNISLEGMPDPLVNRILRNLSIYNVTRGINFWNNNDGYLPKINKIMTKTVSDNNTGQSWVYGVLTNNPDLTQPFIRFGDFKNISNEEANGYIVNGTGENKSANTPCNSKDDKDDEKNKFNALKWYNTTRNVNSCEAALINRKETEMFLLLNETVYNDIMTNMTENNRYLIITNVEPNKSSDEELSASKYKLKNITIYNIEDLREAVIGGYYFRWNNSYGSDAPPNFLQRMLNDTENQHDKDKGIFSFIITSEFTQRASTKDLIPLSRVDYEYYNYYNKKDKLYVIKGLPGCKTPEMCMDQDISIGKFAISENLTNDLGLNDIACKWKEALDGCYK